MNSPEKNRKVIYHTILVGLYLLSTLQRPIHENPVVKTHGIEFQLKSISILKFPEKSSCWWFTYPFEKYEFVSWDENNFLKHKRHVPVTTNQGSSLIS